VKKAERDAVPDESIHRLPHDLLAEAAILGNVLYVGQGERMPEIFALGLRADHFCSEAHGRTFEACFALHRSGRPVSVETVLGRLRDDGRLPQVGGPAFITGLAERCAVLIPRLLADHVERVIEKWKLRQALLVTARLQAQIRAGDYPNGALADALAELEQLRLTSTQSARVLTGTQLWAPRPPIRFAVDRVIPRAAVALIVATGSSLKTWATLDLIIAKATGAKWLGRFPCEKGDSLFWDWESGEDEIARRLPRLHREAVEGVSVVTMPPVFMNSPDFVAAVRPLAAQYSMIAFDSLAAGTVDLDENDARFARSLYSLKSLATATGCTMIVLHHSRKAKEGDDERERPRGTSAIFAAVDVVLQLSRVREGVFRCIQTKARGGKAVEPFDVSVEDLDECSTAVVASDPLSADEDVATGSKNLNGAKARIMRLLANEHDIRSGNEVFRRIRGKRNTNVEALRELKERGMVVEVDGVLRLSSEVKG
jgi:hypothetical protein